MHAAYTHRPYFLIAAPAPSHWPIWTPQQWHPAIFYHYGPSLGLRTNLLAWPSCIKEWTYSDIDHCSHFLESDIVVLSKAKWFAPAHSCASDHGSVPCNHRWENGESPAWQVITFMSPIRMITQGDMRDSRTDNAETASKLWMPLSLNIHSVFISILYICM